MTTQPTEEQVMLINRLVELDQDLKAMKIRIHMLEVERDSLKGSCKAMGRDLSIARRQKSQYLRALNWFVNNLCIGLEDKPEWLLNTLGHVVRNADKKAGAKE